MTTTAIVLIALQVLDVITTLIALRNPKLQEGNKYLKWLMDRIGVAPTLLAIKGGFIALLIWAAPHVQQEVIWAIVIVYVAVVWNNLRHIKNAS